MHRLSILCLVPALAGAPSVAHTQTTALGVSQLARIDTIFAKYARTTGPGCALGISQRDAIIFERAWGSANLEYDIPITPSTIFEAGSVSKQFTAAAVILLAQRGRLSLDDDIRKHIPEMPAYDQPIRIRHLINHTSGLRDWGAIMTIAGWPRGTRTYTHAHVLDIITRQKALNYPVGAEYLYSNSNYNLLAIIAERVSGKSLPEFTRSEIFAPLGMTRTGWRDDYTRIVPGRAQAYAPGSDGYRLQMPNENVYGNSSLLTTVGDLLRWNANFANPRVGGAAFVTEQERRGRLTNGREIAYAGGLFVDVFANTRSVSHDGATAGYRAFLARYPETEFSIALLCNAADANPSALGLQVASAVLGRTPTPPAVSRDTVGLPIAETRLMPLAGTYRSSRSDEPLRIAFRDGRLRQGEGPVLVAVGEQHFTTMSGRRHMLFEQRGEAVTRVRVWVDAGDTTDYLPAGAPLPSSSFGEYSGGYRSDEADVAVAVRVVNDGLVLVIPPGDKLPLQPIYRDGFGAQGSYVKFTRDAKGRVNGFFATTGRARNIWFGRVP